MAIIYIVFGIILGYFLFGDKNKSVLKRFHKYLASPSTGRLELNWSVRQLLMLVSEAAAQRWYESRVFAKQSVLDSLLCVVRLVDHVVIDYMEIKNEDSSISKVYSVRRVNDANTYDYIKKYIKDNLNTHPDWFLYSVLIAGKNVVELD